jgi:predicted lactoylglutathione lyase
MVNKIFINLPVQNLEAAMGFFTAVGFTFDQKFTDETAACMRVTEDIFVMLLTEEEFRMFTPNEVCDAGECTETLLCLSLDSREAVDELVRKAISAGGKTYNAPRDYGFMYGHAFQDLDGHVWEVIYMDPSTIKQG